MQAPRLPVLATLLLVMGAGGPLAQAADHEPRYRENGPVHRIHRQAPSRHGMVHGPRASLRHARHPLRRIACGCIENWRPGYYEARVKYVRAPGSTRRVWVPGRARFNLKRFQVSIGNWGFGHYERVYVPGRVRKVHRKVWVRGGYVVQTRCRGHLHH